MAKLRDIAKGTRAVRAVPFRPANAPPLPAGETRDEHTVMVGVRVLTGAEMSAALTAAQDAARSAGVPQWLDTHPLCRLHEMVQTLVRACVDIDSVDSVEPFFVDAKQILESPEMGGENIAYLWQQQRAWEDECHGATTATPMEVVQFVLQEADRPDNAEFPFSHLRPSSQRSLVHSMAVLCVNLLTVSSLSISQAASFTTDLKSNTDESPEPRPEADSDAEPVL